MAGFPAAVAQFGADIFSGFCGRNSVITNTGVIYQFLLDANNNANLYWIKSLDFGRTWTRRSATIDTNVDRLCVWYDKQTPGDSGTLIHIAWVENLTDNAEYCTLDTASDTVSSHIVGFNGLTSTSAAFITITKTKAGTVHCCGSIDAGTENFHFTVVSPFTSVTAKDAGVQEAAQDELYAVPGNYADTDDFDVYYNDVSVPELTRKTYDASANTWSESAKLDDITSSLTVCPPATVTIIRSSSLQFVAYWNAFDLSTADLRCLKWDGTTTTQLTNIVTNSDDCAGVQLTYDESTSTLYAFYFGKSDGSETATTSWKVYYKTSTDAGSTWSAEQTLYDTLLSGASMSAPHGVSAWPVVNVPNVLFQYAADASMLISVSDTVADTDRAAQLINGGVVRAA